MSCTKPEQLTVIHLQWHQVEPCGVWRCSLRKEHRSHSMLHDACVVDSPIENRASWSRPADSFQTVAVPQLSHGVIVVGRLLLMSIWRLFVSILLLLLCLYRILLGYTEHLVLTDLHDIVCIEYKFTQIWSKICRKLQQCNLTRVFPFLLRKHNKHRIDWIYFCSTWEELQEEGK